MERYTRPRQGWVRVAITKGLVVSRRDRETVWLGRALRCVALAKQSYRVNEGDYEKVLWSEMRRNECSICASTDERLICPFILEGIGAAWPVNPDGEMDPGNENKKHWRQLRAKPVKVMDNYVCGDCRV